MKYYPFGALIPNRHGYSKDYRYGYQGSEKNDQIKGEGNDYTTHYRHLDPRVGRWMSRDPKSTAFESPYASMKNSPMLFNDKVGDTVKITHNRGFLGLGKKEQLTYVNGNLFNSDGSRYNGRVNGYLGKVMESLGSINSVAPGANMLREMETSNFVFNIQKTNSTHSGNEFVPDRSALASLALQNPALANGAGSGGNIYWNPSTTQAGPNQRGNTERPPFIGLAHEFGHALMSKRGTLNATFFSPNDPIVEFRTITNDDFNAMHLENQIRSSFGLPLREFYTKDGNGNGFMRALNQGTNTSINGYDYSINNPIQINYNGRFSGR
ncbi:M91 family zinc metallopeptidase [Flavobacterium columnare]|nr:M91 family zinc metallopeptidase [Flavobacterium columnare]